LKFLRLKKVDGQELLSQIQKKTHKTQNIIDPNYKIEYEEEFIFFPIEIENFNKVQSSLTGIQYDIIDKEGIPTVSNKPDLMSYLEKEVPKKILEIIPKSYDIIGDIVIVEFDRLNKIDIQEKQDYKRKVAEAILHVNKSVKTVYEKRSEVSGIFRLRNLEVVVGVDKSETIHKENKTTYKLDVQKVFFSPRLVFERKRVSESDFKQNEIIVDMFAGVGPFSIQIARNNDVEIHAFDINPIAVKYLKENMEINKVKNKISGYNLNVKELLNSESKVGKLLHNKIDRIIMNLPENSFEYLDVACFLIKKSGGTLHFYTFSEKEQPFKTTIESLSTFLKGFNFKIETTISQKIVKAYSPKMDLVVVDCVIKSED
jgi:tRNA (guanine37-N1)-methyltransferase